MSGRPGSRGRVNAAAPAYVDGEVDGENRVPVGGAGRACSGNLAGAAGPFAEPRRLDTWRESDLPGEPDQGCVVER